MLYTRRRVIDILLFPEAVDIEEVYDVQIAMKSLRERQSSLLTLFAEGYELKEAAVILNIQKPYRFFRNAIHCVVRLLNTGVK